MSRSWASCKFLILAVNAAALVPILADKLFVVQEPSVFWKLPSLEAFFAFPSIFSPSVP